MRMKTRPPQALAWQAEACPTEVEAPSPVGAPTSGHPPGCVSNVSCLTGWSWRGSREGFAYASPDRREPRPFNLRAFPSQPTRLNTHVSRFENRFPPVALLSHSYYRSAKPPWSVESVDAEYGGAETPDDDDGPAGHCASHLIRVYGAGCKGCGRCGREVVENGGD